MTIEEARALAAEFSERVKSIGSSETQHSDIGRLLKAASAITDLATQLADPALAKAAYDAEQVRLKAEAQAEKDAEAAAKKAEAEAKKADVPAAPATPEPELQIDRQRETARKTATAKDEPKKSPPHNPKKHR